jgi:hypothetical protein
MAHTRVGAIVSWTEIKAPLLAPVFAPIVSERYFMQLPEAFRRGVVAPLSDDSQRQLSQWNIEGTLHVEFIPILDEATFYFLWRSGVFHRLNAGCSSCIDDREEEVLNPIQLLGAVDTLRSMRDEPLDESSKMFVEALFGLCYRASTNNRPVFFIL